MKSTFLSAVFLFWSSMLSGVSHAAETQSGSDQWQFTITPYLWIATIKGSTGVDGGDSDIDTGYSFLSLDNLEGAFFVAASASKGRWTLQTDFVYLNFADNPTIGPFGTTIDLKGGIIELSAAYSLQKLEHTEFLFGVRRVALGLDVSLTPGPTGEDKQVWLDPIVGLRYKRPIGERWHLIARGDLGGFGFSSDLTVNIVAGAGFNMTKHSSLFLGYRYLTLDFNEDEYLVDLTAEGFALGVEFNF